MASRLELHSQLVSILGNNNVYFQPPSNIRLKYPCIIYTLSDIAINKADNLIFKKDRRYDVKLIIDDPDNDIVDKILEGFQYCDFDRLFVSDNLYHYVFTIFY
jgi:hypothetical protein